MTLTTTLGELGSCQVLLSNFFNTEKRFFLQIALIFRENIISGSSGFTQELEHALRVPSSRLLGELHWRLLHFEPVLKNSTALLG